MLDDPAVAPSPTAAPEGVVRHRSPFEGHMPAARPAKDGSIGVLLSAGTISSVTQIATWPNGTQALDQALAAALGLAVPALTGDVVTAERGILVRSGPQEFLLMSELQADMVSSLRRTITAQIGSVTDLSHARCHIAISGGRCLDTLSKLFALDLRAAAFPVGKLQLTGHHHLPCLLHRRAPESFDLYVFTTYAFDQLSTLMDAALEYGVRLDLSHANGVV